MYSDKMIWIWRKIHTNRWVYLAFNAHFKLFWI